MAVVVALAAVAVAAALVAVAAAVVAVAAARAAAATARRLSEAGPRRGSAFSSRRLPPGRVPQRPPPAARRGSAPGTCQSFLRRCCRFVGRSCNYFLFNSGTGVIRQLAVQWKKRLFPLKAVNASTQVALLPELKNAVTQTVLSFGSEQITSSFGLSTFPVNSSSNSVSSFSSKTSPKLVSASSGNLPAFGRSSSGVTSSPSVSRSVGFGKPKAPLAASFSLKTSETTGGFGAPGFSRLGKPKAPLSASFSLKTSETTGGFGAPGFSRFGKPKAPLSASFSLKTSETTGGFGAPGFSRFGNSSPVKSSSATQLPASGAFKAAGAASPSNSSNTSSGQKSSASGHNITSVSSAATKNMKLEKLFTPKSELSAEDLKQFEAKRFTLGKIPLQPPPLELLNI